MGRADSLAVAAGLDRPTTAYLARFPGNGQVVDLEVSWAELARDALWCTELLSGFGLERGHRVLLSFYGYEGPWFGPVIEALRSIGAGYATADAMGWDHHRVTVFHQELRPHAVIGLSLETLEGLSGQVELRRMFADTPMVLARPDAVRRLRGAGVAAGTITPLGPALALECHLRQGAHVNAAEWRIAEREGELVLSAAPGRAPGLGEVLLGVGGSVVGERCDCGSDDPRVLFR
ncbi:hypothetical protein EDD99_0122 [Streptomyces sp. 846.5]|nr:hypothetical protein [Streptomyces sp. 846.5]TDU01748.1 hypothetical protein EDD99_0122 [Streptomyces sp. 846.5]